MRKKFGVKKIVLLVILVLIISGLAYVANAFNGNPISKYFAKNEYKKYIEKTYPDTDFEVSRAWYNFKDGNYGSEVISASRNLKFNLTKNTRNGIDDDYRDKPILLDYDNMIRFKDEIVNEINKEIENIGGNEIVKSIYSDLSFAQGKYNKDSKFTKDLDEEIKIQVDLRREQVKDVSNDKVKPSINKNKLYIDKGKEVIEKPIVEKPIKGETVEGEELVMVINDEFINIAYEIKDIIVNMGYQGLTEIGFEFVDSNYNYEYILLEKKDFNVSKENLINFKAKDSTIFDKGHDEEKLALIEGHIKTTLKDIENMEELRVSESSMNGTGLDTELYLKILKKNKPTKQELAIQVFEIKELIRTLHSEIKYLNIEFYEYGELNAKGGNWGQYYGSIFIGNEFSPWEITEEEVNTKLKVWEGL